MLAKLFRRRKRKSNPALDFLMLISLIFCIWVGLNILVPIYPLFLLIVFFGVFVFFFPFLDLSYRVKRKYRNENLSIGVLLGVIALIFSLSALFSVLGPYFFLQEEKSELWIRTYGGPDEDHLNAAIHTKDGGFALVGYTRSFGNGMTDIWLVKVDENGTHLWNKTYGEIGSEEAYSLAQTHDGGFILVGYTADYDIWIIKTNNKGTMEWNQSYEAYGESNLGKSVIQTSEGNFVIAAAVQESSMEYDWMLMKIDANGSVLWNQTYGTEETDWVSSLIQTTDGGFVLAGSITRSSVYSDMWLVKVDRTGDIIWDNTYGGEREDYITSIIQTQDGGYAFTAYSVTGSGVSALTKITANGSVEWNLFENRDVRNMNSVIQTSDGGFVVSGRKWSDISFTTIDDALWLMKVDANGNKVSEQTHGGPAYEEAQVVIETNEGTIVIAGDTKSYGVGISDFYLVKTRLKRAPTFGIPGFEITIGVIPFFMLLLWQRQNKNE
jgi:hypothetical protein